MYALVPTEAPYLKALEVIKMLSNEDVELKHVLSRSWSMTRVSGEVAHNKYPMSEHDKIQSVHHRGRKSSRVTEWFKLGYNFYSAAMAQQGLCKQPMDDAPLFKAEQRLTVAADGVVASLGGRLLGAEASSLLKVLLVIFLQGQIKINRNAEIAAQSRS